MRALLFLVTAVAATSWVAFREPPALPKNWVLGAQTRGVPMPLKIALKQQNLEQLAKVVDEVSYPNSPKYGKHWTTEQLAALTAPTAETLATVQKWLESAGVRFTLGATRDIFHLDTTTNDVAHLFNTEVGTAFNLRTHQRANRAGVIRLPAEIAPLVETVFGVHGLPLPTQAALVRDPTIVPYNVTPDVIEKQYKVSGVTPTGSTKNLQAVAEFQGQYVDPTDVKTFFSWFVKAHPNDDTIYKFVGPNQPGSHGIEAELDIEYIMGVAPGIKSEFWEFPAMQFCLDLVNWTQAILSNPNPPNVFSVSYGWQGNLTQIGCHEGDVETVDKEFQKLAAKGIAIIFASGDSGSGEHSEEGMADNHLWPSWPASSPYVTAVGSTRFLNNQPGAEMSTDQFGSGGGFSFQFNAPSYQKDAVDSYFKGEPSSGLPPSGMYARNGRATPDVAALGEGFSVVINNQVMSVGGTSASAPTYAALVSLANEKRIQAGKSPLGFLNPWIYQNAGDYMDVTHGNNRIGRFGEKFQYGYDSIAGWDPSSGFGTPDFQKMVDSAMRLP